MGTPFVKSEGKEFRMDLVSLAYSFFFKPPLAHFLTLLIFNFKN